MMKRILFCLTVLFSMSAFAVNLKLVQISREDGEKILENLKIDSSVIPLVLSEPVPQTAFQLLERLHQNVPLSNIFSDDIERALFLVGLINKDAPIQKKFDVADWLDRAKEFRTLSGQNLPTTPKSWWSCCRGPTCQEKCEKNAQILQKALRAQIKELDGLIEQYQAGEVLQVHLRIQRDVESLFQQIRETADELEKAIPGIAKAKEPAVEAASKPKPITLTEGVIVLKIDAKEFLFKISEKTKFADLIAFVEQWASQNDRLVNSISEYGIALTLSPQDRLDPAEWNNRHLTAVTYPILNSPQRLARYVLARESGIQSISAEKPVASLNSGPDTGIVSKNIRRYFSKADVQKFFSLLETEKSGPIASIDEDKEHFYIYYSKRYIPLLAKAAQLAEDELLLRIKSPRIAGNYADNLSLIYIAYGDLEKLSVGSHKTEADLTPYGREVLQRYKELLGKL